MLDLTPDELLTTTRTVRRRLDLQRPLDRALIEQCLAVAVQAPTGGNRQDWAFVVVTEAERKAAMADVYRRAWDRYVEQGVLAPPSRPDDPTERRQARRIGRSARHLVDHLHDVPAIVVACHHGRFDGRPAVVQASMYGSVLPAVWSFMLAARARGLGAAWTTIHLFYEEEFAQILGIPYAEVTQVAMVPLAHSVGVDFRPGRRAPVEDVLFWEAWESGG